MKDDRSRFALIGLGSNLGDRRSTLAAAVREIAGLSGVVTIHVSRLWMTRAWGGPPGQQDFLNAAVGANLTAAVEPRSLLDQLLEIERGHGRVRTVKNGPRTLDVDLLDFDRRRVAEPGLHLPHPGLAVRPFVLCAAADVAPGLVHATSGVAIADLWRQVGTEGVFGALEDAEWWHVLDHQAAV